MFSAIRKALTPRTIRGQMALWWLGVLATTVTAFAVFVFSVRARALHQEADAELEIHAQQLAAAIAPALQSPNVAEALAGDTRLIGEAFEVREREGRVVFRSPAFVNLDAASERVVARAAGHGEGLVTVQDRSGETKHVVTVVVDPGGARPLAVHVAQGDLDTRSILRQLWIALAAFFFIVMAIATYGGDFIARRALTPVDNIVTRVRTIQASQLNERLAAPTGSEEVDRLVETLNDMLDRMQASMNSARRFAADASHELQTPIAAMRTAMEVCRHNCCSAGESEMINDVIVELERMSLLVRDLSLLALADAGHLLDKVDAVDLKALVDECSEIARAEAEPKQIRVEISMDGEARITGNQTHLRRAMLNLMINAVRYSSAGTAVRVTVATVNGEAVVRVADEGCGISPDDLPHIFERFYRADPARARESGGAGLGLAIADEIVRGHGGRIEVSSVVGEGSVFSVFLPLTTGADHARSHIHTVPASDIVKPESRLRVATVQHPPE